MAAQQLKSLNDYLSLNLQSLSSKSYITPKTKIKGKKICIYCKKQIKTTNFTRHLKKHRVCNFCPEGYHNFRKLKMCPVYIRLVDHFFPPVLNYD